MCALWWFSPIGEPHKVPSPNVFSQGPTRRNHLEVTCCAATIQLGSHTRVQFQMVSPRVRQEEFIWNESPLLCCTNPVWGATQEANLRWFLPGSDREKPFGSPLLGCPNPIGGPSKGPIPNQVPCCAAPIQLGTHRRAQFQMVSFRVRQRKTIWKSPAVLSKSNWGAHKGSFPNGFS